jgi:hypothetical protein
VVLTVHVYVLIQNGRLGRKKINSKKNKEPKHLGKGKGKGKKSTK